MTELELRLSLENGLQFGGNTGAAARNRLPDRLVAALQFSGAFSNRSVADNDLCLYMPPFVGISFHSWLLATAKSGRQHSKYGTHSQPNLESIFTNMEKTPDKLIDEAVAKAGSYEQLTDKIAYEARTLRRVRSGEIPLSDKLANLLEKFLASPTLGEPISKYGTSPGSESNVELAEMAKPRREIPVYTFVQAGMATDYQGMPTYWDDKIGYDGRDKDAFALRVAGDSMEPAFPAGTIITVEPAHPPHAGQLVVAKIKEEGVVFKLYHPSADFSTATLTSYNPLYPPRQLPKGKFHWIYRVVSSFRNL